MQAVCAALFARERGKSNGGQHIEIAMLDVGANFFWPDGMALTGEMLVNKDPATLSGSRPSRRPPQVLMPTKVPPHFYYCDFLSLSPPPVCVCVCDSRTF